MMEVAWRSGFEVCSDQRLGDIPARGFACVTACIRCGELGTSAAPSAAESIPNAKVLDQIVRAMSDSAMAGLIDCPGAAIQHGRSAGRMRVIRAHRYTSG
jgi:hypothetical protein